MEYRQLGKTALRASVLGVGAEHLKNASTEEVEAIFGLGLKEGVNYFDLIWSFSSIVVGLRETLKKHGTKAIIAFHLGSCVCDGKYKRSRDPCECEKHLRMQLELLNLNSAPVLNIHYVPNLEVWRQVNQKGVVSLAGKLKQKGLAEAISISTHEPEVVKLASKSGSVDCVMHQVNVANHLSAARTEALQVCKKLGIGVVAMKPFAGGELLRAGRKVRIPAYKTGWKKVTFEVPLNATSARLLSYVLDQPGVCTAVIGVSSTAELAADLAYLKASEGEKDYKHMVERLKPNEQ